MPDAASLAHASGLSRRAWIMILTGAVISGSGDRPPDLRPDHRRPEPGVWPDSALRRGLGRQARRGQGGGRRRPSLSGRSGRGGIGGGRGGADARLRRPGRPVDGGRDLCGGAGRGRTCRAGRQAQHGHGHRQRRRLLRPVSGGPGGARDAGRPRLAPDPVRPRRSGRPDHPPGAGRGGQAARRRRPRRPAAQGRAQGGPDQSQLWPAQPRLLRLRLPRRFRGHPPARLPARHGLVRRRRRGLSGPDRPVQHRWLVAVGRLGLQRVKEGSADPALRSARRGHRRLPAGPAVSGQRPDLRRDLRLPVAGHRAPDQWSGGADLRRASPVGPGRHRLPQPSGRGVSGRLAGGRGL
uniref:LigA n=1 Tax=Parastrongyloides trichosuri TaxID=131310 RepID=A0A0N4ZA80_PARTI